MAASWAQCGCRRRPVLRARVKLKIQFMKWSVAGEAIPVASFGTSGLRTRPCPCTLGRARGF